MTQAALWVFLSIPVQQLQIALEAFTAGFFNDVARMQQLNVVLDHARRNGIALLDLGVLMNGTVELDADFVSE